MTHWLTVITITTLAVISPGPDFAMVTRNTLVLSRRAGWLTALGIALGVWVHVGYTLLGVGMLMRESIWLFHTAKLLGAGYLVYLGWRMLRSASSAPPAAELTPVSSWQALRMGFLTNALNPKTTVFIVSLFMQVLEPQTPWTVPLAYGAFISLAHLAWFSLVATGLSAGVIRQRLLAWRQTIDRLFGGVLMALGAWMAATRGSP
ncbi:MAG: LysE family transporter [Pseudomonadota bacterium]|nr:LysE family transporter [Pseudomonadota bacterium]